MSGEMFPCPDCDGSGSDGLNGGCPLCGGTGEIGCRDGKCDL